MEEKDEKTENLREIVVKLRDIYNILQSRKNDKLDCWVEFCKWIETLQYSELITG